MVSEKNLWAMSDRGLGVCSFSGTDSGAVSAVKAEQGVACAEAAL